MRLTTERLILREFVEDDWPAVLAYQQDPRYLRYYPWTERTSADVRAFVQMFVEQRRASPRARFQLAVTLSEDGRLIANCGIRLEAPGARKADIGYELNPDYWCRGYASEAATAVVHYGFSRLGDHRIWASCLADNTASARVLEKLGMRLEGRLRANEYFKGRWWDTLLYAILVHEWLPRPQGQ